MDNTLFARYEQGVRTLLELIGPQHSSYEDVLTLQQRLQENFHTTERYGDTDVLKADRARIIAGLNRIASNALDRSFNDLCEIPQRTIPTPPAQARTLIIRGAPIVLIIAVGVVALLWSRGWFTPDDVTPPPSPTQSLEQTLDRLAAGMTTMKAGDFYENEWQWQGDAYVAFLKGTLEISTRPNAILIWAEDITNLEDIVYTVESRVISGDTELGFGPVFWYRDPKNYYHFAVQTGWRFHLIRWRDGIPDTLVPWTPSPAIQGVYTYQQLGVMTQGRQIRLFVNGTEVRSYSVDQESAGGVGLFVESPGLTVEFQNIDLKARR